MLLNIQRSELVRSFSLLKMWHRTIIFFLLSVFYVKILAHFADVVRINLFFIYETKIRNNNKKESRLPSLDVSAFKKFENT